MDEVLAGRYRRVRTLGVGGMGEVWLADDLELGRQVAIKRLRSNQVAAIDSTHVDRMAREARIAARLEHPNIVGLYDVVRVNGEPHLVMQFVDGETLADRIERNGSLAPAEAAQFGAQIAHALDAAHRAGIVHRDVKPANILIDSTGRARLTDFGIARGTGDAAITDDGQMLGTVSYMAPEVARTGVTSPASDVWSLGATLFAAVDGHSPFAKGGESNPAILLVRVATQPAPAPDHAGPLTELISRTLSRDPAERPNAAALGRSLTDVATSAARGATVAGPQPGATAWGAQTPTAPPVSQAPRRRRTRLLAAVAVAVIAAAVVVAVVYSSRQSAARTRYPSRIVSTISIGDDPSGVAISPDDSHAYVTNTDGTVSVIDLATNGIAHTIAVGTGNLYGVAVTPDGSHVFVANSDHGGAVSVIDTADNKVTATIQISAATVFGVVVAPNGRVAYASIDGGTIAVIDAKAARVIGTIQLRSTPHAVVVSSDGRRLYTTDSGGTVSVIDTATNKIIDTIRVGGTPHGFVITPDGERAYTTETGGTVSVIDTATDKVIKTIGVGSNPRGLAITPDGAYVYVADRADNTITVIDAATDQVIDTIKINNNPHGLAMAQGPRVYVASGDAAGDTGGSLAVLTR